MKQVLLISILTITLRLLTSCGDSTATSSDLNRRVVLTPDTTYTISSFVNDADDPVNSLGIDLAIGEDLPPLGDIQISTSSSNAAVVPDSNLYLSGSGLIRNLKIIPVAAGYSTITIKVVDGDQRRSYYLNYAASQIPTRIGRRWHTGIADASAAVTIENDYMLVANDESNYFYLYHRNYSALPVSIFDYNINNPLALTDSSSGKWKEVDVEGAVKSIRNPSVIYWIGSMSNNSSLFYKPNRNRLFAVTVSGKAPHLRISNAGHISQLREYLIRWGDKHGYDFGGSAAVGRDPKTADGFNIEGMVFGPDNKTLYIAFRSPLVPTTSRTKAVIAPVKEFETWFNSGSPVGEPNIGDPIELDLGSRGIRDIIRLPNGSYVIIGGSYGPTVMPAIFAWSGQDEEAASLITSFEPKGLNVEGVLPVYEAGRISTNKLQVLNDNGTDIFYGDTILAKDLPIDNLKKFSSVIIESPRPVLWPVAASFSNIPFGKR